MKQLKALGTILITLAILGGFINSASQHLTLLVHAPAILFQISQWGLVAYGTYHAATHPQTSGMFRSDVTPDLATLAAAFQKLGGPVFGKKVLDWDIASDGIQVRTNVTEGQMLVKLSAKGGPKPYQSAAETTGNGVSFSGRTLYAYDSKWDFDYDDKLYQNTILAESAAASGGYASQAINQVIKEYLNAILLETMGAGVRNASGSTAADIFDGYQTIIAAEVAGSNLTPVTTGSIMTYSSLTNNAETKVKALARSVPKWLRKLGGIMYCSFDGFDAYADAYATNHGYQYKPSVTGDYMIDNTKFVLRPVVWFDDSQLAATIAQNFVFGTNIQGIEVAATLDRNIIKCRPMMRGGTQIQDLDALIVNDQFS